MGTRRTPMLVAVCAAALLGLGGCGSQVAPQAGPTTPSTTSVPGTRPAPTDAPATSSVSPAVEQVPAPLALTDQGTGDFVAGLGTDRLVILEIGIHGVGKAWNTKRAIVTRDGGTAVVHYDGPGRLDARAHLGLAAVGELPVKPRPIHLRVVVTMTSDGLGRAEIWIDGRHHVIVADQPPHTAAPVVAAVVAAFAAEEWSSLYDLSARLPGLTRAQYVKTFGADSSVTSLELTGGAHYRVAGGVAYAEAPAHVVATVDGRRLDRDVAVRLVYQRGQWRFSNIARAVGGS